MSMNFYWVVVPITLPTGEIIDMTNADDPRIHLGKITNNDFCWAQDPLRVRAIANSQRDAPLIMDENGGRWTGGEFLARIAPLHDRTDYLGNSFC